MSSFRNTTRVPNAHRISPKGPNPHRVIEFDLLGEPGARGSEPPARAGFTTVVDNARVRALRLVLEPSQSAELTPRGNSLMVVVKGGAASIGGTPRELKPGEAEWNAEPTRRTLRNEGSSRLELVEVEVK